jgi:hypothetical protein
LVVETRAVPEGVGRGSRIEFPPVDWRHAEEDRRDMSWAMYWRQGRKKEGQEAKRAINANELCEVDDELERT